MAQQNRPSPPPLPPLSPSSFARRTGTRPARAATRPGHLLLLRPPPASPAPPRRRHGAPHSPWLSLTLSLASSSPLLSLPLCPSGARRHRRRSPRPQPPPRSLFTPLSSVPTPWSCTPTHATRGGPSRPERRRLHLRCPEIAAVNSRRPELPRPRRRLC